MQERDEWTSAIQEQIRSILLQNDSNKSRVCIFLFNYWNNYKNTFVVHLHDNNTTVRRKHTTAHNGAIVCHYSSCAIVRWLIVIIYCPSRGLDSIMSTG